VVCFRASEKYRVSWVQNTRHRHTTTTYCAQAHGTKRSITSIHTVTKQPVPTMSVAAAKRRIPPPSTVQEAPVVPHPQQDTSATGGARDVLDPSIKYGREKAKYNRRCNDE
jgi:hypothetical protein